MSRRDWRKADTQNSSPQYSAVCSEKSCVKFIAKAYHGHLRIRLQQAIFELLFASISKRDLVHSLAHGYELDLQDNERARKIHFNTKRYEPKLVLKHEVRATRNGCFMLCSSSNCPVTESILK